MNPLEIRSAYLGSNEYMAPLKDEVAFFNVTMPWTSFLPKGAITREPILMSDAKFPGIL